jgi:hypothetical protein
LICSLPTLLPIVSLLRAGCLPSSFIALPECLVQCLARVRCSVTTVQCTILPNSCLFVT